MASGAKTRSKTEQARCKRYQAENTFAKNKRTKLEAQLKEQPNNEQIKTALKNIKWSRCTPKSQKWSATDRFYVQLYKAAGLSGKDFLADKVRFQMLMSKKWVRGKDAT